MKIKMFAIKKEIETKSIFCIKVGIIFELSNADS